MTKSETYCALSYVHLIIKEFTPPASGYQQHSVVILLCK